MACEALRLDRIDICIVATRRPTLLERTLRSFQDNLFRYFEIGRFIANIDPLFGTKAEEDECVALIRSYDPNAAITLPERAGFATAVASNWLASTSDVIFHLEDDWLLNRPVHPDHLQPFSDYPWLGQISFNHADKHWNVRKAGTFSYVRNHIRLFHRKIGFGAKRPNFVTGPSFLRGSFAKTSAGLMKPTFDPEKQFCRNLNHELQDYVAGFRNLIVGEIGDYYIQDLGRQWRREHDIQKRIVMGQSIWTQHASRPGGEDDGASLAAKGPKGYGATGSEAGGPPAAP